MSPAETQREQVLKTLAALALAVASSAPIDLKPHQILTQLDRSLLEAIRKACDDAGIDWRKRRREAEAKRVGNRPPFRT